MVDVIVSFVNQEGGKSGACSDGGSEQSENGFLPTGSPSIAKVNRDGKDECSCGGESVSHEGVSFKMATGTGREKVCENATGSKSDDHRQGETVLHFSASLL